MKKSTTLLLYGVLAVGAYVAYKRFIAPKVNVNTTTGVRTASTFVRSIDTIPDQEFLAPMVTYRT